ncbi:MAG TPA: hypothetical protein VFW19_09625, partial [Allosphingosinicella sp.]|nr:hypothetical protein [Allosphingosinicella sp.]
MFENQLLEEFRQRLFGDTERERAERSDPNSLAADIALTEIVLGDLEEAGVLSEHDLCPHEDVSGRNRSRIIGYSLAEDSSRLELITSRFVPQDEGTLLPAHELSRLAGQAARFFGYAARGEHDRFQDSLSAKEAARRIKDELDRIEDIRIHIITNALGACLRNHDWRWPAVSVQIDGGCQAVACASLRRLWAVQIIAHSPLTF